MIIIIKATNLFILDWPKSFMIIITKNPSLKLFWLNFFIIFFQLSKKPKILKPKLKKTKKKIGVIKIKTNGKKILLSILKLMQPSSIS